MRCRVKSATPGKIVAALCAVLDGCNAEFRATLRERLSRRRAFAWVKRQVSPAEARKVAALDLEGIGFMTEPRRFYPNTSLGAHVIGYVGLDNQGLGGIEAAYNPLISGRSGTALIQTDARRHVFSRTERRATTGATVQLTIDQMLQWIAERELKAGVREHRAKGGTAIIMDPWTGEILAMANEPTFNPNAFAAVLDKDLLKNRAVQDIYEPGSTFKIVTASAALDEKLVKPADIIDVSHGSIQIGSRRVNDMHRYGPLSFEDVIVKSSNVGAIKVGFRVGAERMGRYVRRFGFGSMLSPDVRGESPGIVWSQLNDSALASVSMGYQIGVTPLQMVTAVSSVANGGRLMEPHLVRATAPRWHADAGAAEGAARDGQPRDRLRADDDHGRCRRSRHREGSANRWLHDRREDGDGREARARRILEIRLHGVVRRIPAVTQAGHHRPRRPGLAARQGLHRRRGRGARVQTDRGSGHPAPRRASVTQSGAAGAGSPGLVGTGRLDPHQHRSTGRACGRDRPEPNTPCLISVE